MLPEWKRKRIQEIVGVLLYYGRSLDITIIVDLIAIAARQNAPTEQTANDVVQLLDYIASHPNDTIRYHASDIHLKIHSDAS